MTTQPDTRPAIAPQTGRRYVLRNGYITPPMEHNASLAFPFQSGGSTWSSEGRYRDDYIGPHQWDIVEEYHEPLEDLAGHGYRQRIKELEQTIATRQRTIAEMGAERVAIQRDLCQARERIAALEQQVGEAKAEIQPQVVDALRDRITRLEHELAESIKDLDVALREKLLHDERSMKLDSDRVIDGWVVITPNNLSNSKYDSIKHAEERVMGLGKVALCYARVTMMCEAATVTKREPHWTYPNVPLKEKT